MIVGMDFGTTNSGMAVHDGRRVNLLPLDPSSPNPNVVRTSLYVTNDQAVHIGREAIDYYFEQNVGRPVRMRRVWIGELEIFGADMYYVTDAYATVDLASPGRLMLSMKTSLRDADYPGTVIGQFYYPLEDLIALYMTTTRIRAEKLLGQELRQVVLGRPVRFATDPQQDALAQSRLLRAAFRAGYEKVYLQKEPIAAAMSYEMTVDSMQHALIFDFGGGTLDITIMRLGDPGQRAVLATGGIPVAGDVFDRKLVRAKLPPHFGEGSRYGPRHKALTVPRWIYDAFSNWQTILDLETPENRAILNEIAQSAQRRYQIEALISLVSNNHGLRMFDIAERAKRLLSQKRGADMVVEGPGFKVLEFVTRSEFERIIHAEILAIEQHLDETVQASGLKPDQIDAVIRTGGSSQIPVFHEMLQRKFGPEKVRSVDTFSSVTAGLAIVAHGIELGEFQGEAHLPGDTARVDAPHARPNVSPINLDLLKRRIQADETADLRPPDQAEVGLTLVSAEGQVTAIPMLASQVQTRDAIDSDSLGAGREVAQAGLAQLDEQLMLITSRYRFLLTTPRQLFDLGNIGLTITDIHQVERHEKIQTANRWLELMEYQKLLLVTSSGYTRSYPLNILRTNVEAPVPLKFDQPLPGVPIAAAGTDGNEELVLVTRKGRVARFPMQSVLTSGFQALNCSADDRVAGAAVINVGAELVLVTADGFGRRLASTSITLSSRANVKGVSAVARRSDVVALFAARADARAWLLTSKRLRQIDYGQLPLLDSTRTQCVIRLEKDEMLQAELSISDGQL